MQYVQADDAITWTKAVLQANGVCDEYAKIIAQCLVAADLRGVDSHGINRIIPYMAKVRKNAIDVSARPELREVTPVVAQVDGKNNFGFIAASLGMTKAIEMASVYGIGVVSIKHSNHYGMAAWLVQRALDANMLSMVYTNSSPALAPWGGRTQLIGVSPLACGAPGVDHPFILDMAPSVAARGKLHKARRRGEKIPLGWALDAHGAPTEDPAAALDGGVMLPMGGPKGSALAIMMDVFSGVLSGAAFAGGVKGPYDPSGEPADVGHFLFVMKPDLFMSAKEFRQRMEVLYRTVVTSEPMQGVERIYFPGEIEQITERERRQTGIPFAKAEIDALNAEAEAVGVARLNIVQSEPST